jgi:phospholipid/cholesterol/gamma-HCH transport system permease protein
MAALMAKQRAWKGTSKVHDLLPAGQDLLAFVTDLPAPKLPSKAKTAHPLVRIGQAASMYYAVFVRWVVFFGQVLVAFGRFFKRPSQLPWRDVWSVFAAVGPNAWFIVALMGTLFGLILGFQSLIALRQFGAQIFVANLVGVSMMRELAPLMTAVILIGRSGSAFAAELGGMSINQEVDALRAMAIDPIRFLVMPRVLAAVVMMPWMSMVMLFFSLVGCGVVMKLLGYSMSLYMAQLQQALSLADLLTGLVKTFFFGFVVAVIGCQWGLSTQQGATAVGHVTTGAVVSGIVAVVALDGVFGTLYYYMGI